jgi:hypothetical protein
LLGDFQLVCLSLPASLLAVDGNDERQRHRRQQQSTALSSPFCEPPQVYLILWVVAG